MGTREIWLLAIIIAIDAFIMMAKRGAQVPRIRFQLLLPIAVFYGFFEILAFSFGELTHHVKNRFSNQEQIVFFLEIAAVLIFFSLSAHFITKALMKTKIEEKREESVNVRELINGAMTTSLDAIVAGAAIGLLHIETKELNWPIFLMTTIAVITGTYAGYRLGYEKFTSIYMGSGIIMLLIGIQVLIKFILV